jgi:hypothetical protein
MPGQVKQGLFNFLVRFKKNSERLSDVIRISGEPQRACLPETAAPERPAEAACELVNKISCSVSAPS